MPLTLTDLYNIILSMFSRLDLDKMRRIGLIGLALIGALALLILAIALIARPSPQGNGLLAALGSIFLSPTESISVTANPDEVPSGGTFHLSWRHETERGGRYEMMLTCPDGVSVHKANRPEETLCNKTAAVDPDLFLLLSAFNKNKESAALRAAIFFNPDSGGGSDLFGGFVLVTIGSESKPETKTTAVQRPTPSAPSPAPVSRPSVPVQPVPVLVAPSAPSLPDLAVRVIDTGTTTQDAKQFFPAASVRKTDLAAVLFEVSNLGRVPIQEWSFEAWLPIESSTFKSVLQPSLPAGASVRFVLGFSGLYVNPAGAEYKVTIRVDPESRIKELSEDNNSAIRVLSVVN